MKVQIVSDLHTEHRFGENRYLDFLKSDAEVLVVAGDLTTWRYLKQNIGYLSNMFPHVLYVAGNHDYYGASFKFVDGILADLHAKIDNFTWLNNSTVEIGGQRFIGASLWFEENPLSKDKFAQSMINDFGLIKDCDPIAFHRYDETVRYFKNEMKEGDIVVTHQMPSEKSIPPMFEKSLLNCYFANPLDDLIVDKKPSIWIHGHTHSVCRYIIGNTQIICNPLGYPNRRDFNFQNHLIIDV